MAISPTSPGATSAPSSSTTRIRTPRMGVPIEPGLRTRSGWLNEATGEVSDRPYPSRIMQPNSASNPRSTSTGSAAPPETHTRSADRSYSPRSGAASSATYIVGTPSKMVTRSRAITCSAFSGVNRDTRVRQAPTRTAVLSPQVCPNEWNSGRPPKITSSAADLDQVGRDGLGVGGEISMREFGALGLPGGARCVQDDGGVRARPVDHGHDRRHTGDQVVEAPVDDHVVRAGRRHAGERLLGAVQSGEDQPCAGVVEVVGDLARLQERVHGDDDRAGAQHRRSR